MAAKIVNIEQGSPAERAGVRIGERLLQMNDCVIHDVLDFQFESYEANVTLLLEDEQGHTRLVEVEKDLAQPLGLTFDSYLMDDIRTCKNKCMFCFIDQLPKGMRESLYVKDDDFRLSFLYGNYISLTNLTPEDIDRILLQRISPLNISVHTTDPDLRNAMMGNRKAGESLRYLRRLAEFNISIRCQIVLCEGINDGEVLLHTLRTLKGMYPSVNSISVVPYCGTRHREGLYPLKPISVPAAKRTIRLVEGFARNCLKQMDTHLAWCSDEFYIRAGLIGRMHTTKYYEDFSQFENGVGALPLLMREFREALPQVKGKQAASFTVATGESFAPILAKLLDEAKNVADGEFSFQVVPIRNDFFGGSVTTAGLITGQDLVSQLSGRDLGGRLLITGQMLRGGAKDPVFLDDMTVDQVSETLGVPIQIVGIEGKDLLEQIFEMEIDAGEPAYGFKPVPGFASAYE